MHRFAEKLLPWFKDNGRRDLPWQQDPTPYSIWVSEIMLQQTQVATVIPYFERFMAAFPTITELAAAEPDKVLHLWTGLGYYARARNLHKAARIVVTEYNSRLPDTVAALCELPGIGRSTAGAIVAIAWGQRAAILDGNVKRVLTRCFAVAGWPEQSRVKAELWGLAESLTPQHNVGAYTQAIMDLGATVCTRRTPACSRCPVADQCIALAKDAIEDFPAPRPRKPLPVRATVMHLLQNERQEVLLQKRPPTGIWGGLWSLPETTEEADMPTPEVLALKASSRRRWPVIRHTFTHFHLDITPVYARVSKLSDAVLESRRWLWYPLDKPAEVGLAAPVRKLLERLRLETADNTDSSR